MLQCLCWIDTCSSCGDILYHKYSTFIECSLRVKCAGNFSTVEVFYQFLIVFPSYFAGQYFISTTAFFVQSTEGEGQSRDETSFAADPTLHFRPNGPAQRLLPLHQLNRQFACLRLTVGKVGKTSLPGQPSSSGLGCKATQQVVWERGNRRQPYMQQRVWHNLTT